ncbi:hypothetical protein HPB47_002932 [Ixodes persulcatus]|uniref:Uncharacterized protein n=1 Tax=Ixodes persulcatus TaxID=34615 RepID=A0AC60PJS8_IXOPE|nr:hypothetical protein HPB47_002932 [Ixodes persulcatus]
MSTNSTEGSHSSSPSSLNAPRYGTMVPKRIFVGGISPTTTEAELHELFSRYGVVTNTKIIADRAGVSKGSFRGPKTGADLQIEAKLAEFIKEKREAAATLYQQRWPRSKL